MTSLEHMLLDNTFFRIHRSYIVNVNCIDSVSGNRVFINNKEIPISTAKRDEFYSKVVHKNLISK